MTLLQCLPKIFFIVENQRATKIHSKSTSGIRVLVADSSQMHTQLLTSALRRHPEFQITSCSLEPDSILRFLEAGSIDVLLLDANSQGNSWQDMALLRRIHVSFPKVAKILLIESFDRDLVVNAFRSGARGLFCFEFLLFVRSANASRLSTAVRSGRPPNRLTT